MSMFVVYDTRQIHIFGKSMISQNIREISNKAVANPSNPAIMIHAKQAAESNKGGFLRIQRSRGSRDQRVKEVMLTRTPASRSDIWGRGTSLE